MRFAVLVFALSLAACQSKDAGLQVVCDAPVDCADCMTVSPDQRQMALAKHITDKLSNSEVQALMETMANLPPEERLALFEGEARAAGLASCPMVDALKELEGPGAEGAPEGPREAEAAAAH